MQAKRIVLRSFRNIASADLTFSEGTTVLNGENGQGKTNLLEAVSIAARGRSFLTSHENELINFDSDLAELRLIWSDGGRDNETVFRWMRTGQNAKRFIMRNRVPVTRLSELVGGFRTVLFCPRDLSLVQSGPAERRRFLDIAISEIDGSYLRALQRYGTALSQRNALIKQARDEKNDGVFLSSAEIWSEQLAAYAEIISNKRDEYVNALKEGFSSTVADMTAGGEKAEISYLEPRTKEDFFRLLTSSPERELRAGTTLYGIHHDDLRILLGGRDARVFASQGQQKTVAVAMKMAEGELSKRYSRGGYPVYLLDDILSELDSGRRKYLLSGIADKQVIITSCDRVEGLAGSDTKIYKVRNGVFS